MRRLIACLLLAACARAERPASSADVILTETSEGPWRLEIVLDAPARTIDLGASLGDLRATRWRPESGLRIEERDGRDVIVADAPFRLVHLDVDPVSPPRPKDYQPFAPLGDGVVLFTGHFEPASADGRPIAVRQTFIAAEGRMLSAFGQTGSRFENFESPDGGPAFVHIGRAVPAGSEAFATIVDPATPAWVAETIGSDAPRLLAALGADRSWPPVDMFVAAGDFSAPGRLGFRGDALSRQLLIALEGEAWRQNGESARRTLLRGLAHEAAHLRQQGAPKPGAPAWIHEGGAEAAAGEALARIGIWDDAERRAHLGDAIDACDRGVASRTLSAAEAAGDWPTVYACGHALTVAAAAEAGPIAFHQLLDAASRASGGYDADLFLDIAAEVAGPDVADALRRFLETKAARPADALRAMLPRAAPPLAVGEGR